VGGTDIMGVRENLLLRWGDEFKPPVINLGEVGSEYLCGEFWEDGGWRE